MSNEHKKAALVNTTAKDFFLYLAFVVTLVWLVTSFFMGSFSLIDAWLPDLLHLNYWHTSGVFSALQSAVASLVIVTPFFLVIAGLINRDLRVSPEKKDMWVRKWMLYALLFISFVVTLTDMVLLSNSFFQGELTSRFALKSLVVFAVAVAMFSYFFYDLRRDFAVKSKIPLFAGVGVGSLSLLVIVLGFVVAGSPAEQRERRLDNDKVDAIQQISWEVESYLREYKDLPENLSDLNYLSEDWRNPVTGEGYIYRITSESSFEICADFSLAAAGSPREIFYPTKELIVGPTDFGHGVGESCFEYRVRDYETVEAGVVVPEGVE